MNCALLFLSACSTLHFRLFILRQSIDLDNEFQYRHKLLCVRVAVVLVVWDKKKKTHHHEICKYKIACSSHAVSKRMMLLPRLRKFQDFFFLTKNIEQEKCSKERRKSYIHMSEFRHPVFKGKKYPEIWSNIDCDEFSLTSVAWCSLRNKVIFHFGILICIL